MHIETVKLFSDKPVIGDGSLYKDTTFEEYTEIGRENRIDNSLIEGYSYTGDYCYIQNSHLKRFISMADMVRVGPTNHPYERPSQHISAYNGDGYGFPKKDTEFLSQRKKKATVIGNDVWIGHGVVVQAGVTVGDGAVLGSGTVVTKDVEPYTIVGGIPAKKIKDRFPEEIKERMLRIKWWNWSREELEERYDDLKLPIEDFCEKYD